ncbi:alpha/beta fold hydrolase [Mariniflexile litorale]|uniref:Alpha/beta fold hydrolase n=1 Tax=Mariniflexile litorale TaxID=3045158 RepID=A0AAU7EK47_9FLAO|nr:alpha/beta fold hydrolase [Mariniflexile sp. KMM 9835]MDQ8212755.1 alpha/beta hydrolase [Mariniflexile sp. KMM 9835]
MNKKINLLILIFFISHTVFSQSKEEPITLTTKTGDIQGSLYIADSTQVTPVVLIIAGSGPTDRNGNNPMMVNNSLKLLAEGLSKKGIASIRFDKRGIAESKNAVVKEADLRFENYINDVKEWCNFIKKDSRFSNLIIVGHSEGSLIGMIASQDEKVNKFISLAGAGFPAGEILKQQLEEQPPLVLEMSLPIIEKLEKGEIVNNPPQMLSALFRPSVQPYLISWFKYNPQLEISKLNIPILIIQGTTDIQVSIQDAEMLSESSKNAKKVIIKNMNHVLKEADVDRTKNIQTYSNPKLPLIEGLITSIVKFINQD